MTTSLLSALPLTLMILLWTGCKKDNSTAADNNAFNTAISAGTWNITSFMQRTENKTSDFAGIDFTFFHQREHDRYRNPKCYRHMVLFGTSHRLLWKQFVPGHFYDQYCCRISTPEIKQNMECWFQFSHHAAIEPPRSS